MQRFGGDVDDKAKAIAALRDIMATLKWEIWETEKTKRNKINSNEWEQYINARFWEWPYFNLYYIDGLVFKPKGVTTYFAGFDHLRLIQPKKANAFLFNKRFQ